MWFVVPSVLWRCWLGGRKGMLPVKNWVVRCWHGYLSGARCRLAYAQLMPLRLTVSCFSKIQIGFTFLVPAHPGSPGKRAVKWVCVVWFVSVCLSGSISLELHIQSWPNFGACYLWLWLSSPLAVLSYILYFGLMDDVMLIIIINRFV